MVAIGENPPKFNHLIMININIYINPLNKTITEKHAISHYLLSYVHSFPLSSMTKIPVRSAQNLSIKTVENSRTKNK
jgi:hypothetical protein